MLRSDAKAMRLARSTTSRTASLPAAAWLGALVVLLLLLSSLPYLYGSLVEAPERRFMGIILDVPDTTQYFAWLRAHQQDLVVSNTMTPEPNEPAFFNLLWLMLGRLASWTGLSFVAMLHLLRVVGGAAFAGVLFWLYGMLEDERAARWQATLLVLAGGGSGWIWVVDKYLTGRSDLRYPLDVQVAEPNAFLSLMGYPHFLLAAALLMAAFGLYLLGGRTGKARYYAAAAVIALVLSLQHAYDLIMLYMILGAYVLLLWRARGRFPRGPALGLVAIGVVSSPPAAYFTYLTTSDPIWRGVLAQFANAGVFTPNPLHLLVLLGPQLPLAWAALPQLWRRRDDGDLLLLSWTVVGFALLYIPTDFQIHMLNPYQVPLGILAIRTARRIAVSAAAWPRLRWVRRHAVALLILAALPVNLYLLSWRFIDLRRQQQPYYLHRDEVAALQWLDQQPGDQVVFSSERLGQYVPGWTGKRAVLAHWAQSVDYYVKTADVAAVFDPATAQAERDRLLARYGAAYLMTGPQELAAAPALEASPLLEQVWRGESAAIYRIAQPSQETAP